MHEAIHKVLRDAERRENILLYRSYYRIFTGKCGYFSQLH
jgi:hypothetical protein